MITKMQQKSPRYHHLDALRAIMMILGIVIHTAITFGTKDHSAYWGITDTKSQHAVFDAIADLIHLFRMPIFFVIAGFFAAMLFFERGAKAMIQNRIKRILLPFVAAVAIILPINILAFSRTLDVIASLNDIPNNYTFMSMTLGESLSMMHLWFLYYLMLICVISWLLTKLVLRLYKPTILKFRVTFERLFLSNQLFWISIVLTFLSLLWANNTFTKTSLSFIPNPITLYTYTVFFSFGWFFYHIRQHLNWFGQNYKKYLYTGLGLCLVRWAIPSFVEIHETGYVFYIKMGLASIIIWLLIYGITGLFIHKFKAYSFRMRYISDASYWIYLTHLPITAFLPSLVIPLAIPAISKFLLIIGVTAFITLTSYHYLVRSTFIGQFLNGRKY